MDSSTRKALIRKLLEGGAPLCLDPTTWAGDLTVSTRNTMYRFVDGVCTMVQRAGHENAGSEFIGMRLAGWLIDEASAPRVSPTWRPGACAILLRPGAVRDSVALTSATVQIRRPVPVRDPGTEPRIEPPKRFAPADSMTRIGVTVRGHGR